MRLPLKCEQHETTKEATIGTIDRERSMKTFLEWFAAAVTSGEQGMNTSVDSR